MKTLWHLKRIISEGLSRKRVILRPKKSHIKRVFLLACLHQKRVGLLLKKKVNLPKNATESQRHNILMRDDPDYLVAFRAAQRSAADIKAPREREQAVKLYRDRYYSEIKKRTDYGRYLTSKYSY